MCVLSGCKCEITFKAKMIERGFFCRIFCIMKLFIKRGKNTFHLEITFTFFQSDKSFFPLEACKFVKWFLFMVLKSDQCQQKNFFFYKIAGNI